MITIEVLQQEIEQRIMQLELQLQQFLEVVNREISMYRGAIEENKKLLERIKQQEQPPEPDPDPKS